MSDATKIEWADSTFNPWSGCTKVGPGCDHCYAESLSKRAPKTLGQWGAGAARRRTSEAYWRQPLKWNREHDAFFAAHERRRRVFCASLADVFDNAVPSEWRRDLFELIAATPNLDWLLLTKRIGNVRGMVPQSWLNGEWPAHVWLGATICNQPEADRDIAKLIEIPARVRFLSIEPMLSAINLRSVARSERGDYRGDQPGEREAWTYYDDVLTGFHAHKCGGTTERKYAIDWVIAGGESGAHARPAHPEWFRSLRDQCAAAGVPFLFKQWGEWAPYVNEAHFTEGGAERHAHAWIDARSGDRGSCWIIDDDGSWSNWTGEPRMVDAENLHSEVAVMGRHGKKAAGRSLDGITHNGFPEAA